MGHGTLCAGGQRMGRPIIGITGELEAARWGNWISEAVVSPVSYTRAVDRAGGPPVILPPVPATSVPVLIAGLSGLLLTGGRDFVLTLYDEAAHEQTDIPDHRRDRFELILTRAAIDADLPFLAIGRGMHILNVARGGTLTQHLPDRLGNESHKPDPVKMTTHDLQIAAASKLSGVLGDNAQVPASHHQAVNQLGTGLLTAAWTSDEVVEALEVQGHRWGLGVQWNPEDGDDPRLFEALITVTKAPAQAAVPAQAPVVLGSGLLNSGRRARGAAPADGPRPAAPAQDRANLSGGPAAMPGDIGPAVPQRPRSLDEIDVVPPGVTPAALGRVSRGPVEFHA